MEWTLEDYEQARKEGWNIWECDGPNSGKYQLQRHDEEHLFDNDGAAWNFVAMRATEGSALHIKALRFLKEKNPNEFNTIRTYTGY